MYRLERMELIGFKSFCERTELTFPAGLTAVVGPNGCGKSNLGDALAWVLGEQSAKVLRSTRMEDVIFSGTEGRRALGMAEVKVVLSRLGGGGNGSSLADDDDGNGAAGDDGGAKGSGNSRRRAAAALGENGVLVVSRRVFRSGESEYLMNGQRCRLRDIHDVLYGTGLGTRGYMVIEQGKVDTILSGRPRERRVLIEEAAGILGYKAKKRVACLKLEATQANLLRIRDLVGEVARQINSLKRQAARARRFRKLQEETRQRTRWLFSLRLLAAERSRQEGRQRLRALSEQETGLSAALGKATAAGEVRERRREEVLAELRKADEALAASGRQAQHQESALQRLREQQDAAEQRAGKLGAEALSLRAEADGLVREARLSADRGHELAEEAQCTASQAAAIDAQFQAALKGLEDASTGAEQQRRSLFEALDQLAEARAQHASVEENVRTGRARLERLSLERAGVRRDRAQAEQELEALSARSAALQEAISHGREAASVAARERARCEVEREQCARERAEIAGKLQAAETFRRTLSKLEGEAASAGAGESRPRVADFVQAEPEVEPVVEAFAEEWLACRIVDVETWTRGLPLLEKNGPRYWIPRARPLPEPPTAEGAGAVRLVERLRVSGPYAAAIRAELAGVLLAGDGAEAFELARKAAGWDVVALDGTVITRRGVVFRHQRGAPEFGVLGRRRLARETDEELETLRRADEDLAIQSAAIAETLRQAQQRERAETQRAEERSRELAALSATEAETASRRQQLESRERILEEETASLALDLERWEREAEGAREAARVGEDLRRSLEASSEAAQIEAERRREALGALHAQLQESRGLHTETQRQMVVQAQREEALAGRASDLLERSAALEAEAAECRGEARSLSERIASATAALRAVLEERGRQERERARLEQQQEDLRAGADAGQIEMRRLQQALEAARLQVRECEVALARADSDWEHLEHECRQELDLELEQVRPSAQEFLPERDACEQELVELRDKLSHMGPVNLLALEEYQELEQRHQFLIGQQQDLDRSVGSLRQTIQRLNRRSQERFMEAFEHIRANFHDMFRVLFRGGRAELRLEEGEDVLECGLEVNVQPPGKRLQSILLLSGGEKALAALALLFSIFRYKPSPFCLLDEVDAALDDSNVERFLRIVHDFQDRTQFVLITHNKRSMEAADVLYGVTMEEPGISKLVSVNLT
ncbi:MAG: chromosome segregation protein SMC [Acidobacteriota bacterium]